MYAESHSRQPLAFRLRPTVFDEFYGQEHLTGPQGILQAIITSRLLPSLVLWGPPGSGKTTLAYILAKSTEAEFISLSAVTSSIREVKGIMKSAERVREVEGRRTILFIDEIHRFNKAQQDAFLPYIENGTIILIGATIENPSFYVIGSLLSRVTLLRLKPLSESALYSILARALNDKENGLGSYNIRMAEDVKNILINLADGDARIMLNVLETAGSIKCVAESTLPIDLDLDTVLCAAQTKHLRYDKKGEEHYNLISAFIKSLRGSDPDASLYWLVRMIDAGEDPLFIARRMIICASEDIGNADPKAIGIAVSAYHACQCVGLPEGELPLAQAAIYLACTSKSNAVYKGIKAARSDVSKYGQCNVPDHLRNPSTAYLRKIGYGKAYKYPHDYPDHFVDQQYLPSEIEGHTYYVPGDAGVEAAIKRRLNQLRKRKQKS